MKTNEMKTNERKNRIHGGFLNNALKKWREGFGFMSVIAMPGLIGTTPAGEMESGNRFRGPDHSPIVDSEEPSRKRRRGTTNFFGRRDSHLLPHQVGQADLAATFTGGADDCPGTPIAPRLYTRDAPFMDSGDTSTANNTVDILGYYYYGFNSSHDVKGRDLAYSFTLSSRGANPEIRVSSTVSNYVPAVYILDGRYGPCPTGSNNLASNFTQFGESRVSGQPAILSADQLGFLPLNTPLYLFVDARNSGHGGPYTLTMSDLGVSTDVGPRTRLDFGRDGSADLSVFRPSDGRWYISRPTGTGTVGQPFTTSQFGLASDVLAPADYDGDGSTDIAVFRDGIWFWLNSSNNSFNALPFGLTGDIPQSGDYDGDGRAELALYREGVWYSHNLRTRQFNAVPFGIASDKPVAGDYDGDGRMDEAVFRDGIFYLRRSLNGFQVVPVGIASDIPVPANYGDGSQTVPAVFRAGTWIIADPGGRSPNTFQFGLPTDIPVPADYDGFSGCCLHDFDDPAVYRDGVWYIRHPNGGFITRQFGQRGDMPLAAPRVR